VAAVLHDQSLYWISAGDSRIYLLRAGRLTRITSDHTYGRQLDEQAAQGKISRAEALNNSERGSLTSYLGQPEPKELDRNTRPLALQPGDSVILCSDGFYRALNESEIAGAFDNDLQRACETLVGQAVAKQRKGQDNLTVIALQERGRRRRLRGQDRGGKASRLPVYASALVILALLSAGAAYWYRNRPASATQVQQTPRDGQGSSAGQGESAPKEVVTAPPENPPHTEPKQEADTSAAKSVPRRQPKVRPKRQVSTAPRVATAPEREAGGTQQNASGSAQPTTPTPTTPTPTTPAQSTPAPSSPPGAAPSEGTAGDAASAPASQTPPAAAMPANPPASTPGTSPAPAPGPGNDQQKPPESTPPPPANDSKPNGPPNLAFGGVKDACLRAQLKDDRGKKDGTYSCHS